MITMLLGGLWHGANWTFVVWGAYHGLLLIVSRYGFRGFEALPELPRKAVTFLLVVVGWVLFRADNLTMALGWLGKMFVWDSASSIAGAGALALLILISGGLAHGCPNSFELSHRWGWASALALTALFAACMVVIYGAKASPFLYFQF